jgi:hypothetical protein
MAKERIRLGELLVQASLINPEQLNEILALQKQDGRRLGVLIVEKGLVTEFNVTQVLSQQLSVPWVALQHIDFSQELLTLVPAELAERYCMIPIYVRRVRGLGNVLYVAMDDPTNQQAIDEVSKQAGLPIRTMIAPPSHIRGALYDCYGVGEPGQISILDATPAVLPSLPVKGMVPGSNVSKPPSLHGAEGINAADVAKLRLQWNEFLTRVPHGAPALHVRLHSGKVLKLALATSDGQFAELPIAHEIGQALKAASEGESNPDWPTILGSLIASLIQAGIVVDLKVAKPEPPAKA